MKLKEALATAGITGKIRVERKMVPISQLDSMSDYQRHINMAFVEEKSRDGVFDENEVSIVLVSVRADGSMKVCDGQHTVAILKKRGYTMVECELRYGLTEKDENDWFATENSKRRPQTQKAIITAKINGSHEKFPNEHEFNDCIKAIGFKLDIYGEQPGGKYKIKCIMSVLNLYIEYKSKNKLEEFTECFDLLKTSFDGDPISLQWNFIRGLFDFYETFSSEFDRRRFVLVMKKSCAENFKVEADTDKYTQKPSHKFAKLFVQNYNNGLAQNKRIKMSKLDD